MVDSNDMAFRAAAAAGVRQGVAAASPTVLEPVMNLEVTAPSEFQGSIIGGLNKRGGLIMASDPNDDGSAVIIKADVPLAKMFGYSTDLRSSTQGKGEFTMEFKQYAPVSREDQDKLIKQWKDQLLAEQEK